VTAILGRKGAEGGLWRPVDLLWQRWEMDEARAIEKLTTLGDATAGLMSKDLSDTGFVKWRRDSEVAISHIFGPEEQLLRVALPEAPSGWIPLRDV